MSEMIREALSNLVTVKTCGKKNNSQMKIGGRYYWTIVVTLRSASS